MWTTIHTTSSKTIAEQIKRTLTQEGILVSLRTTNWHKGTWTGRAYIDIMVPEQQAKEAAELLHWMHNSAEG